MLRAHAWVGPSSRLEERVSRRHRGGELLFPAGYIQDGYGMPSLWHDGTYDGQSGTSGDTVQSIAGAIAGATSQAAQLSWGSLHMRV